MPWLIRTDEPKAVIDIREYLTGLDHDALVDLLVERAAEDDVFDARLRMAAARATAGAPPIDVFRHALDEAFMVRDYVDYRHMYDYASTIDSALDSLRELLDDGHAEAVITLAEHAIDRAEDALGYVDDSDGYMSGIAERLQELHRDACAVAKPEPVALARTLFERERHSGDLDVFYNAAGTYADVLGAEGIAEYRRLAKAEWDALPPLGPGQEERSYSSRRFRITQIMETLAELTGDVDAVADVLARDQSSAYQFVRIAELYTKAGRYDDALAWAEKGLALHGGSDSRLVEAAAEGVPPCRSRRGRRTDRVGCLRRLAGVAHLPSALGAGVASRAVVGLARQDDHSPAGAHREGSAQARTRARQSAGGAGTRRLHAGRGAPVRRRRRAGMGGGERSRMPARPLARVGPAPRGGAPAGGDPDLAG